MPPFTKLEFLEELSPTPLLYESLIEVKLLPEKDESLTQL